MRKRSFVVGSGLEAEERRNLTIQATKDAARIHELERKVEGVADPFRDA